MTPRATPLPPAERRATIIAATRPLIAERGPRITTREIAKACGIAEGTIFRVFDSKVDLITAVIDQATDPGELLADIPAITGDTLRERCRNLLARFQAGFREVSVMFATLYTMTAGQQPPPTPAHKNRWHRHRAEQQKVHAAVEESLKPFADQLRIPLAQAASLLIGYATISSHGLVSDGTLTDTDELVDLFLHGTQSKDPS